MPSSSVILLIIALRKARSRSIISVDLAVVVKKSFRATHGLSGVPANRARGSKKMLPGDGLITEIIVISGKLIVPYKNLDLDLIWRKAKSIELDL
jgi:hypothetical protein